MGTGSREWTGPWRKTSRVSCALDAGEQYCNGNMRHPARRRKSSLQSGVLYFRLRDALPPTTSTTTVWSCSFFRPFAARERANRNPGFRPGEVGMSTTWSTGELMRHQSQRPHARSAISYSTLQIRPITPSTEHIRGHSLRRCKCTVQSTCPPVATSTHCAGGGLCAVVSSHTVSPPCSRSSGCSS